MKDNELVSIAWDFLRKFLEIEVQPPVNGILFKNADDNTPYDRWLVVFLTHPNWQPDVSVVEIKCSDLTPSIYSVI